MKDRAKQKRWAPSRQWHSSMTHPLRRGWYEVRASNDRWEGRTNWRAWGCGQWWTQIEGGWIGKPEWEGQYEWRGPSMSVMLDYDEVVARAAALSAEASR